MSYLRQSCPSKELAPSRQKAILQPVLCILSFVALFSATPSLAASTGWAAIYGGAKNDSASSIQQTGDGGYIVAGETDSFGAGGVDVHVLKLNFDGTVEWQKSYGGRNYDSANSIQQTDDGGYIVAAETMSFGAGEEDIWVLKLRSDGSVEWQKTYGGGYDDSASSIQQTDDKGYIVAGDTWVFSRKGTCLWVLKLRPDGTIEWQKTYEIGLYNCADSIRQTGDGGYVVTGHTDPFGTGNLDVWVLKLNSDGTVEWQKSYSGMDYDRAFSIQQTNDGGYTVAGETESFGTGRFDAWVLKLNPDGTPAWQKTYGGLKSDNMFSIQQTGDGGYIVAGETKSFSAGWTTAWVLKLSPDGTVEWQKSYGTADLDLVKSTQQTSDEGYIAAGYMRSFAANGTNIWVLKLRSDGTIDPSCNFVTILDTSISGKDTGTTAENTRADVRDTSINPQNSHAIVLDTNVSVNILCPSTADK